MTSDPGRPWWRDPGMTAAAAWIFGCAAYYYVRCTLVLAGEYDDAVRELLGRLAGLFAPERRGG